MILYSNKTHYYTIKCNQQIRKGFGQSFHFKWKHFNNSSQVIQMDFAGTTQIPDPVRITNGYGNNDISYSFMCYTNLSDFENPLTIDEQIDNEAQVQFQVFGQIFYSDKIINQLILQTNVKKEKILSVYIVEKKFMDQSRIM